MTSPGSAATTAARSTGESASHSSTLGAIGKPAGLVHNATTCPPERGSFSWTPFAKTGDPDDVNASANPPRWPVSDVATDGYLELEATDDE